MNMRWNLDSLYTSFDSQELQRDLEETFAEIDRLKLWCRELDDSKDGVKAAEHYIAKLNAINDKLALLMNFAELSASTDTKNTDALRLEEKLDVKRVELTEAQVVFNKWFSSLSNADSIIESSPLLREHGFYLREILAKSRYTLSEKEEEIIARMANTGSGAWGKLQKALTSNLMAEVTVDGETKEVPISQAVNMGFSNCKETRKAGYEAELAAYAKIAEPVAACLNGIKGEVLTTSSLRGYASPLEKTLMDFRMDFDILNAMMGAVKKSLPAFHSYYRKKAALMGYTKGLPYYELFAPIGRTTSTFTFEEAGDYIVRSFAGFSDKLAALARKAFGSGWIDAEPRAGKRGGAFCSSIHPIRESRILANFNGSYRSIITLAHELGHAYHNLNLYDESYINSKYPSPIAETASIFCETILQNASPEASSYEERLAVLDGSLIKACSLVVDIYSRYLFETELFKRRKQGSLSVEELKEMMENAQKEAFGDSLDHSLLHPYMWVNKPHYYYPERNFYNFPYTFGLLFAKGLYAKYLGDKVNFPAKYDELLSQTGKKSVGDLTLSVGIDIRTEAFWLESIGQIKAEIDKFLGM